MARNGALDLREQGGSNLKIHFFFDPRLKKVLVPPALNAGFLILRA